MRHSYLFPALFILAFIAAVVIFLGYAPARASMLYGPPARSLSISERVAYSTRLLLRGDLLVAPRNPNGDKRAFRIERGESISSIASRLEEDAFIVSAEAFYDYVVYTGMDRAIQAGDHLLSPAMPIIDLARELQDATPEETTFVILPGWRLEEIAASLPTSGLEISPQTFIAAASSPPAALGISPATMEGFFYPDSYLVPRSATVDQLLDLIARNFVLHVTDDMRRGFAAQGLDLYQAVTLASIIEREAVRDEERALIASVFFNRLKAGMTLGSDPTVQYALGYDPSAQTWWKNPLSLDDLKFDSPYNTYIYAGLPPAPISNPSLGALQAAAFPETSPYYYFQAACDGSGYHVFAVTFEEHLANGCR